MARQRHLHENPVDLIPLVQRLDQREQLLGRYRFGRRVLLAVHAHLLASFNLVSDVNLGSRIRSDQDDGKSGLALRRAYDVWCDRTGLGRAATGRLRRSLVPIVDTSDDLIVVGSVHLQHPVVQSCCRQREVGLERPPTTPAAARQRYGQPACTSPPTIDTRLAHVEESAMQK